jgi:CubicO group peptidase (beta-lactamase class C family)
MPELNEDGVGSAAAYFDRWLAFRRSYLRLPGIQASLLHGDRIVLSTAHGEADVERSVPLTPEHRFRVASHSKTFTATAVLQLAERGRLRLDDRVDAWVGSLAGSPVGDRTLRELLAHGSGVVRDGADGDFWQLFRPFPGEDELRRAAEAGEIFAANERFKYSNVGYGLLGLVVAAASGSTWAEYVRREIVERLGLRHTGPDLEPSGGGDHATGYTALAYGDGRLPIEVVPTGALAAATGFSSTADDLCRYASAHFHGDERLLGDRSKRLMQREEWAVEGSQEHYGLGLSVHDAGGRRLVGHGGGFPGHATRTLFDPGDRLAVSVLANAIDAPALGLAKAAVRLVDTACEHPLEGDTDAAVLERFCGRFANLWGVLDVVRLGGKLYAISPTAPDPTEEPTELEVAAESTLRVGKTNGYGAPGEELRFDFTADGRPRSLRGGSGMTSYPLDDYEQAVAAASRVTVDAPLRPFAGPAAG